MSIEKHVGFCLRNRTTHEPMAYTACPTVMVGEIEGPIAGVKKKAWVIQAGPMIVPAIVAYLDPLPEGWPAECGQGDPC